MGNCLQISNRKHLDHSIHKEYNQLNSNDSLNNTKLVLCNHNGDCTNSIFNQGVLKEFNDQCTLTNCHKMNTMQEYEYKNSLNYNNSYPILNKDCIIDLDCRALSSLKWNSVVFNKNDSFMHIKYMKDKKLIHSNLITTDRFSQNTTKNSYTLTTTTTTNITQTSSTSTLLKANHLPLINSSILGFTIIKSDQIDCIEWLHNDNVTYSNVTFDKHKHATNSSINEKQTLSIDWLRYTMFIYQTKLDTMKFLSIFNRMKYFLYSLERKTGCRIHLSKYLFMYKGNLIRLFVIDGPNKQQILQCYSSLPELFTRLLILECERPNLRELKMILK
ncbi:hypothetical protein EWB00_001079 [Schistosoma japonicum]|uniref:Uncharacterized protein n=1 Tax=Schistosoma japonicum TaxID=6182 RepID=A0A4Z2DGQ5_SCHJA|nr:hypothetical protein EWB00_001079 [Schistosoma japonicum]